jgi:hypothetical protein
MYLRGVEIINCGYRSRKDSITTAYLDDLVESFIYAESAGFRCPVKVMHDAPIPGAYVAQARRHGEVITGDLLNVPDDLVEQYRHVSAEVIWPADFGGGRRFNRAIEAVSLINQPGCWRLADLFGERHDELFMGPRPGLPYIGVAERGDLTCVGGTLIPNDGSEFEVEAEIRGSGTAMIGVLGYDARGEQTGTYLAASHEISSDEFRTVRGRTRAPDAFVAMAVGLSSDARLECKSLLIRKVRRELNWIDVYRNTTNTFSGSTLIKSTRNDEYFDTMDAGQTQYYWFRSRDFANNVSSVYPGLTSSFSAAGLFPIARDPEYVFFEEFRYQSFSEFRQKWEHNIGSGDITFVNAGTVGGRVLQSSGHTQWISRTRIPYDPEALYQMTVKVRQTNSVDGERAFTAGFAGFREDGTTPIATNSGGGFFLQHHFVRNNQELNSLDLWVEYRGHARGTMPWPTSGTTRANVSQDPKLAARMHDLTRYVSPHFVLNENEGGGTAQLDYISVRKLVPFRDVTFDPTITAQSNWLVARAGNFDDVAAIGVASTNRWAVQSITNLNIAGEYSVLPLAQPSVLSSFVFFLAERFRPDFHPRMPSSGAYSAQMRMRVTSFDSTGVITFTPGLVAYTRTSSAVAFFRVDSVSANVRPGSSDPALPLLPSNRWVEFGGSITVGSNGDVNPASGPYQLAPAVAITKGAGHEAVITSAWIAYFNITAGNP